LSEKFFVPITVGEFLSKDDRNSCRALFV